MKNLLIREAAKKNGVKFWEIAEALGVSEATVTRRMRREMSEAEQQKMIGVISDVARRKEAEEANANADN